MSELPALPDDMEQGNIQLPNTLKPSDRFHNALQAFMIEAMLLAYQVNNAPDEPATIHYDFSDTDRPNVSLQLSVGSNPDASMRTVKTTGTTEYHINATTEQVSIQDYDSAGQKQGHPQVLEPNLKAEQTLLMLRSLLFDVNNDA